MNCRQARMALTTWRDLDERERERVATHCAGCAECARLSKVYGAQDELLAGLPDTRLTRRWADGVYDATVWASPPKGAMRGRWLVWNLVVVFVCVAMLGSMVPVSAGALPGELLYSVKRAAEQARVRLTLDESKRNELSEYLAERRRGEVRQLVQQQGSAAVGFRGEMLCVNADGSWNVSGICVRAQADAWQGDAPAVGSQVRVQARLQQGQVLAQALHAETKGDQAPGSYNVDAPGSKQTPRGEEPAREQGGPPDSAPKKGRAGDVEEETLPELSNGQRGYPGKGSQPQAIMTPDDPGAPPAGDQPVYEPSAADAGPDKGNSGDGAGPQCTPTASSPDSPDTDSDAGKEKDRQETNQHQEGNGQPDSSGSDGGNGAPGDSEGNGNQSPGVGGGGDDSGGNGGSGDNGGGNGSGGGNGGGKGK